MRTAMAVCLGLAAGLFAFAMAAGLTGVVPGAGPVGLAGAGLVGLVAAGGVGLLAHRSVADLHRATVPSAFKLVSAAAAVGALVQLARLGVFMVHPTELGWSFLPNSEWEARHSCLTAYFVASKEAGRVPDLYDDSLYSEAGTDPAARRKPLRMGTFNVDVYEYPPTFLPLTRLLTFLMPDFLSLRIFWFGFTSAVVLFTVVVTARLLGPEAGTRALLLAPLIWAAPNTISTLQKGNIQLMIVAISVLAMLLFERRQPAAGGALLAYATASKLYPGMLVVYLIVRRQWRALGWSAAFGAAIALATYLDLGWRPFATFLDHLPKLLSGEAFPAFRNPSAVAINLSVPGLVFKLKALGVADLSFGAARVVGTHYSVVVIALTVFIASRTLRPAQMPVAWLAVVFLATLRSPFLPQAYGAFPAFWLLTLLAAAAAPTRRRLALTVATWVALGLFVPVDFALDPRWKIAIAFVSQVAAFVVAVAAIRSLSRRPETAEAPAPA